MIAAVPPWRSFHKRKLKARTAIPNKATSTTMTVISALIAAGR